MRLLAATVIALGLIWLWDLQMNGGRLTIDTRDQVNRMTVKAFGRAVL